MAQIKKLKNYFTALLIVFTVFFITRPVFSAKISLDSKIKKIGIENQFKVDVFVDSEGEDINAAGGKIIFPEKLLKLKEIEDGNSIINFWIERPKVGPENYAVFSGIIPGGYNESKGLIFSMVFQAKDKGSGIIKIQNAEILRNDGQGTKVSLSISNLRFLISKQIQISKIPKLEIKDIIPPESFKPVIARTPEMFNGKYFLVFATQDKGSGIDHYEVREGKQPFIFAQSPYLLQNQDLDREIIVKAIDKNGNEKVVFLPPTKPGPWYKNYLIFVISVISGTIIFAIWQIIKSRKRSRFLRKTDINI